MSGSGVAKRIHFVGIGGIGMSGIAEILLGQGWRVTGSDLQRGPTVRRLEALGAQVSIGHDARHLGDAEWVVISSAIRPENPEWVEAQRRGLRVMARGEMLAELMRGKRGIAVAGSHGKTTVTALLTRCLVEVGLDPTALIGGRVTALGTNARLGKGNFLVAEADESDGSFLHLAPEMAVITNIEPEHLDHYGDLENIRSAFVQFAHRTPPDGRVILCTDDPNAAGLLHRIERPVVPYGTRTPTGWRAEKVVVDGVVSTFVAVSPRGDRLEVRLNLPGSHNVLNALAVLGVLHELGAPLETAARTLARFEGVERRFQRKGEARGVLVFDDYGHHPTEIRATLAAARKACPGRRLVVVFQPHRYTRTQALMSAFAGAFDDADLLVVTDIYPAGEDPIPGVGSSDLVARLQARGKETVHVPRVEEVLGHLSDVLNDGDLLLTLGAGDVWKVGEAFLAAEQAQVEGSQA